MGFAADLASSGEKVLNLVTVVVIMAFSVLFLTHLGQGNLRILLGQTDSINQFLAYVKNDDYPVYSIKGKICTQTFIDEFVKQTSNHVDFNLKPKFLLSSVGKFLT